MDIISSPKLSSSILTLKAFAIALGSTCIAEAILVASCAIWACIAPPNCSCKAVPIWVITLDIVWVIYCWIADCSWVWMLDWRAVVICDWICRVAESPICWESWSFTCSATSSSSLLVSTASLIAASRIPCASDEDKYAFNAVLKSLYSPEWSGYQLVKKLSTTAFMAFAKGSESTVTPSSSVKPLKSNDMLVKLSKSIWFGSTWIEDASNAGTELVSMLTFDRSKFMSPKPAVSALSSILKAAEIALPSMVNKESMLKLELPSSSSPKGLPVNTLVSESASWSCTILLWEACSIMWSVKDAG